MFSGDFGSLYTKKYFQNREAISKLFISDQRSSPKTKPEETVISDPKEDAVTGDRDVTSRIVCDDGATAVKKLGLVKKESSVDEIENMSKHEPRLLDDLNRPSDLKQYERAVAAMKYYGAKVGVDSVDTSWSRVDSLDTKGIIGHPKSLPNTKVGSHERGRRIRGVLPPTLPSAAGNIVYNHNSKADCYYHVIPVRRPEDFPSEESWRDDVSSAQNNSAVCLQRKQDRHRQYAQAYPAKRSHSSPVKYNDNASISPRSQHKSKIPVADSNRSSGKERNSAFFAPCPPRNPIPAFTSLPLPKRIILKHTCDKQTAGRLIESGAARNVIEDVTYGNSLKIVPPKKSVESIREKTSSWRRRLSHMKNRRLSEKRTPLSSARGSRDNSPGNSERNDARTPLAASPQCPSPSSFNTTYSEYTGSVSSKNTGLERPCSGSTIKGSSDSVAEMDPEKTQDLTKSLLEDNLERNTSYINVISPEPKSYLNTPKLSHGSGENVVAGILCDIKKACQQRVEDHRTRENLEDEDTSEELAACGYSSASFASRKVPAFEKRFVDHSDSPLRPWQCLSDARKDCTCKAAKSPMKLFSGDVDEATRGSAQPYLTHGSTIEEASSQPPESISERTGYAHSTNTGLGFIMAKCAGRTRTYSRTSSRSEVSVVRRKEHEPVGTDMSTSCERLRETPSQCKAVQVELECGTGRGAGGGESSNDIIGSRSSHTRHCTICQQHGSYRDMMTMGPKKSISGRRLMADLEKSQRILKLVDSALRDDEGTSSDCCIHDVADLRERNVISLRRKSTYDMSRSSEIRSLAPNECVRQLQIIRNEHIKHVQREMQQIMHLNQFLDKLNLQ